MRRTAASPALEVATLALMTAILLASQVALAALPNIEIVSLLIVLYTRHFRGKTLIVIYAFALLEGLIYGFGLWFINYLYVWTVLWLAAMLLGSARGMAGWVILLAAFGLAFGLLCALTTLVVSGPRAAVAYWIAGIPFDILHAVGNAVVALILFRPLDRAFAAMGTWGRREEI